MIAGVCYLLSKRSRALHMFFHSWQVGDVGLARLIPALAAPGSTPRSSMVQDSHTVGTLTYIDPEYYRSGQFSPRSDIYGLGVCVARGNMYIYI